MKYLRERSTLCRPLAPQASATKTAVEDHADAKAGRGPTSTVQFGEEALKSCGANVSAKSHRSADAASLASSPSAVDVMLKQCSISTLQGVPVARSTALAAASHAAADATPRRNTRAGVPVRSASVRAACTSAISGSL